jgi:hypothetical protein
VLILLLGLACSDPELAPIHDALDDWDAGTAALDRGEADAALAHFRSARARDPGSPALAGWEARALAKGGDTVGALRVLDDALRQLPDHNELRLQRAALRARTGNTAGAATDLEHLYASGALHPDRAAEEPDFASLQADPATAHLVPPPRIGLEARAESGAVLVGDAWTLSIDLDLRKGEPLRITPVSGAVAPGLVRLVDVIEDRLGGDDVREQVRLSWSFAAHAAGQGTLGPWQLRAGRAEATLGPFPIEVIAVGQRTGDSPAPAPLMGLPVPSSLAPTTPELGAVRVGDRTLLFGPPGVKLSVTDVPSEAQLRVALWREGQEVWHAVAIPAGSGATGAARAGSQVLFDGPMP